MCTDERAQFDDTKLECAVGDDGGGGLSAGAIIGEWGVASTNSQCSIHTTPKGVHFTTTNITECKDNLLFIITIIPMFILSPCSFDHKTLYIL